MIKIQQKNNFNSISEFYIFNKKQLGVGSFGVVNLSVHIRTSKLYAIKIINLKKMTSPSQLKILEKENKIHGILDHPHIVKLWDNIIQEDKLYMIMEYVQKGSLFSYQSNCAKFNQIESFKYFYQTLKALKYIHDLNIIHRDLKPQNLLLDSELNIKLCDFGWATNYLINKRNTFCGTYQYMAPQIIFQKQYDYRVDIWSLGILLYQLLHGCAPFRGQNSTQIKNKMKIGKYAINNQISQQCKNVIMAILKFNPQQRISLQMLQKCPWTLKMEKQLNLYYIQHQYYNTHQVLYKKDSQKKEYNSKSKQNKNRLMKKKSSPKFGKCKQNTNTKSMQQNLKQMTYNSNAEQRNNKSSYQNYNLKQKQKEKQKENENENENEQNSNNEENSLNYNRSKQIYNLISSNKLYTSATLSSPNLPRLKAIQTKNKEQLNEQKQKQSQNQISRIDGLITPERQTLALKHKLYQLQKIEDQQLQYNMRQTQRSILIIQNATLDNLVPEQPTKRILNASNAKIAQININTTINLSEQQGYLKSNTKRIKTVNNIQNASTSKNLYPDLKRKKKCVHKKSHRHHTPNSNNRLAQTKKQIENNINISNAKQVSIFTKSPKINAKSKSKSKSKSKQSQQKIQRQKDKQKSKSRSNLKQKQKGKDKQRQKQSKQKEKQKQKQKEKSKSRTKQKQKVLKRHTSPNAFKNNVSQALFHNLKKK